MAFPYSIYTGYCFAIRIFNRLSRGLCKSSRWHQSVDVRQFVIFCYKEQMLLVDQTMPSSSPRRQCLARLEVNRCIVASSSYQAMSYLLFSYNNKIMTIRYCLHVRIVRVCISISTPETKIVHRCLSTRSSTKIILTHQIFQKRAEEAGVAVMLDVQDFVGKILWYLIFEGYADCHDEWGMDSVGSVDKCRICHGISWSSVVSSHLSSTINLHHLSLVSVVKILISLIFVFSLYSFSIFRQLPFCHGMPWFAIQRRGVFHFVAMTHWFIIDGLPFSHCMPMENSTEIMIIFIQFLYY